MSRKLCIFCGSQDVDKEYLLLGELVAKAMAKSSWDLVYGGASVGLMGSIADAILKQGGKAYGVITEKLVKHEMAHTGLTTLEVVHSLHERKQKMYDLADVFVTLPGGIGTLDEFFETLTWAKLKYHQKPLFLLNYKGLFNHLLDHLIYMIEEKFLREEDFALVRKVTSVDELFYELSKL